MLAKLARKYLDALGRKRKSGRQVESGYNTRKVSRCVSTTRGRELSMSAVGYVIDRYLLRDGKGHIYLWDPRYINRDIEAECRKQEALNENFGVTVEGNKTPPIFTLLGILLLSDIWYTFTFTLRYKPRENNSIYKLS